MLSLFGCTQAPAPVTTAPTTEATVPATTEPAFQWYDENTVSITAEQVDSILNGEFQKPNNVILLIGDGPEREKLAKHAAAIERDYPMLHIVLTGYLPDAAAWLPVLDLFVMPSRYEGFGLTLTEALSFGIPALCSQADSLPELCAWSPENTLTADFTVPNLTEVYRKALQLPKLPGKLFHSTGQMTDEYLTLYHEFLQSDK